MLEVDSSAFCLPPTDGHFLHAFAALIFPILLVQFVGYWQGDVPIVLIFKQLLLAGPTYFIVRSLFLARSSSLSTTDRVCSFSTATAFRKP